jgi:hypothetical protein
MLTQEQVQLELVKWMKNFVEQPHPSLGGWSPCPYARQARLSNNIDLRYGTDPFNDCLLLVNYDWSKEVVVFWYNPIDSTAFIDAVNKANVILLEKDIVALEDHPSTEEIIAGIRMNFGVCPIIILQKNSKLNRAADQLKDKGYYNTWNQLDLDKIVTWRYN